MEGYRTQDDDAKRLRDMASVLYEQGKDAAYIIAALTSYAVEAKVIPPPTEGAVDALQEVKGELEIALASEPPVIAKRSLRGLLQTVDRALGGRS